MPREVVQFGGLSSTRDPSRIDVGRAQAMSNADTDSGILRARGGYTNLGMPDGGTVGYGAGYGRYAANEVQRILITGDPTGGSFTITFDGATTSNIAYNAEADDVYNALVALSNIDLEDITVEGGPFPSAAVFVAFGGQYARTDVPLMTTTDSFTGGTNPASEVREEVKGGEHEEYIVVASDATDTQAFNVTPDGVHTAISGATGLAESDWYFAQYSDRIFAVNAQDGLRWKYIGTDRWENGNTPQGPGTPPELERKIPPFWVDFTSATFTSSGFSNPPVLTGNTNSIRVETGSSAESQRDVSIEATFPAALPYRWRDWWRFNIYRDVSSSTFDPSDIRIELRDSGGVWTVPDFYGTGIDLGNQWTRDMQFADENRSNRDDTIKMRFRFRILEVPAGAVYWIVPWAGRNWMKDTLETINLDAGPVTGTLTYAYSYYNVATGQETSLSPSADTFMSASRLGQYVAITGQVSATMAPTDKVYFYRRQETSGKWRRVGEAANSGTPTVDDHYMEHELNDLPEYIAVSLPTSVRAEAITTFKQSLVIAADKQVFISGVGEPLRFAPSPDTNLPSSDKEDDETQPRTVYASDNRAEEVYGVHGQDSLYLVTDRAVYAMVGDFPLDLTPPRRLPGSRGAVGHRASYAYGGGVLVAASDGLWFYSVGRGFSGLDNGSLVERELTSDVRGSWRAFLGDLDALDGDTVVLFEFDDEIWCLRQTGSGSKYIMLSRENNWHEGVFTDDIEAPVPVRGRGLRWQRVNSKFDRVLRDESGTFYPSDDGAPIAWSWTSGEVLSPLIDVESFEIRAVGTPYVRVDVVGAGMESSDGKTFRFDRTRGKTWLIDVRTIPGYEHTITIGGSEADKVKQLALHTHEVDDARGG